MVTVIYALKDPETRRIRYIGQTAFPEKRLRQHLREKSRCHRSHWISELKSRGLIPELEILVVVPASEVNEWETKFIASARRSGLLLVNGTEGGDGLKNPSAETREKIAAPKRGAGNPNFGKKMSDETREKMRAAHLGVRMPARSDEHKRKLGAALRGRKMSPESCAKMAASHLGKPRGPYNITPEGREKLREAGRATRRKQLSEGTR